MDLGDLRREYQSTGLGRGQLALDPLTQFEQWLAIARQAQLQDPSAMTLATVANDGQPSLRTVLLKAFDQNGWVFYSNINSAKAREIAANPKVSLLFPWYQLNRQVIVRGSASAVDAQTAANYFLSRPRDSQLAHWASPQSEPVASRQALVDQMDQASQRFRTDMQVPPSWGGYLVAPDTVEFWQGREHRLHDRFIYCRRGDDWEIQRLAP